MEKERGHPADHSHINAYVYANKAAVVDRFRTALIDAGVNFCETSSLADMTDALLITAAEANPKKVVVFVAPGAETSDKDSLQKVCDECSASLVCCKATDITEALLGQFI